MAGLLKNLTNSIWHAFNALTTEKNGLVVKSKLKVLTANIGTLLDLYGVEKGLEHFRSTSTLNFEYYRYYLKKEVFSSLPKILSLSISRNLEEKIDEVCWLVCKKNYLNREPRILSDECVYKLFRIFCLLGELIPENEETFQVLLHASEVGRVASELAISLGLEWDSGDFTALAGALGTGFRFQTFLAVLESKYSDNVVEEIGLVEAVHELYHTLLHDVLKKGYLLRRGYLLPTLKEYWFVLQPHELNYYKGRDERDLCGSIAIDPRCRVETINAPPGKDKVQRFAMHTGERTFELAASDYRSRLQWLSALQLAVAHSGEGGYQRMLAARRRQQRDAERMRAKEETLRRNSQLVDMQTARAQLETEKMARRAAETQAKELEVIRQSEERKLHELEDVRIRLERLLEEETQAKRDEEIVRNLQARVLREEWEKREELEQLQEEQRIILDQERQKRKEFEDLQREKEIQLQLAETRLKQLEEERLQLDRELSTAREKISSSEKSKEVLEAKLRVIAPQLRESDRVRRALSFMPSTKERPNYLQFRTNSLRRESRDVKSEDSSE